MTNTVETVGNQIVGVGGRGWCWHLPGTRSCGSCRCQCRLGWSSCAWRCPQLVLVVDAWWNDLLVKTAGQLTQTTPSLGERSQAIGYALTSARIYVDFNSSMTNSP
jgi:hypothetical protein